MIVEGYVGIPALISQFQPRYGSDFTLGDLAVEELIGPDITLQQTKLDLKPPAEDARFEWHQDYPFFRHTNFDLFAARVFLDDTDESNRCLRVIPSSHRLGPLEHDFSADCQAYGTEDFMFRERCTG
jgi:hypothetical protein